MQGSGTRRARRRLFGAALLAASATAGCGESERRAPSPSGIPFVDLGGEPVKSGSRLRNIYFVSDEGLRVPTARFFDTKRNEECRFGRNAQDSLYCQPDAINGVRGVLLYEADCRTRVFADCLRYAIPEYPRGCDGSTVSLYALGDVIDDEPRAGPDCSMPAVSPAGARYRRLGGPVPSTEFVRAVAGVTAPHGERLDLEQLSAEDGSAIALGFFDHAEETACGDFWAVPGEPRYCGPAPEGFVDTYFEDDGCTGDGQRLIASQCPIVAGYARDENAYYRLGRSLGTVPPFMTSNGGTCFASLAGPGYELGEPMLFTDFETIESARVGEGRLKLGVRQSSDGQAVLPDTLGSDTVWLWDDELGGSCVVRAASDGEYRCIPSLDSGYASGLYADERCEVPLGARSQGLADGERSWMVTVPQPIAIGCAPPSNPVVLELSDEPFAGTLYQPGKDEDGNPKCNEYVGTWLEPLFEPSSEVPPSRFVRFEKRVE